MQQIQCIAVGWRNACLPKWFRFFNQNDLVLASSRIDFGPAYRVYCDRTGVVILMLHCGGDKSTQKQDIEYAKRNLQDFQNREAQSRTKPQSSNKRAPK